MINKYFDKKRVYIILSIIGFIVLTITYYGIYLGNRLYNSDEAFIVRAAKDMAEGNILLKGYVMGNNSQYVGILLSRLLGIFVGFGPTNIYLYTAIVYSFLVFICCYIAGRGIIGNKQRKSFNVLSAMITFAVIGLPGFDKILTLHNSIHIICYALMFLSYYMVARNYGNVCKKTVLIFSYIPLLLACIDDSFAIYFGVLPLILVSIYNIVILNRRLTLEQKKSNIFNLIMSLACAFFSKLFLKIVEIIGGFTVPGTGDQHFFDISKLFDNIGTSIRQIFYCFSGDISGRAIVAKDTLIKFLPNTMICILCIFIVGILLKRFKSRQFEIQILTAVIFSNYFITTFSDVLSDANIRYYMITFFTLSVILGLVDIFSKIEFKSLKVLFALILSISFIGKVAPIKIIQSENGFDRVAQYLIDNDLKQGYGEFWAASSVVVASNNEVQIAPVEQRINYPFQYLINSKWYEGEKKFFILTKDNVFGITVEQVKSIFGDEGEVVDIDSFFLVIYDTDISANFGC